MPILPSRSVSFTLTLVASLGLILGGCDSESGNEAQPQENSAAEKVASAEGELGGTLDRGNVGAPLPEFTFTDPDGASLSLLSMKGTPTLINLWATWCAPCVLEMPMLDQLAGDYDGKLRVLTISQDMKGAELVSPFFAEREFKHLEPWLDTNVDLSFHYGGGGTVLPTTILYDAEGKEVWRMIGGYDWTSPEAKALVEEALPAG